MWEEQQASSVAYAFFFVDDLRPVGSRHHLVDTFISVPRECIFGRIRLGIVSVSLIGSRVQFVFQFAHGRFAGAGML